MAQAAQQRGAEAPGTGSTSPARGRRLALAAVNCATRSRTARWAGSSSSCSGQRWPQWSHSICAPTWSSSRLRSGPRPGARSARAGRVPGRARSRGRANWAAVHSPSRRTAPPAALAACSKRGVASVMRLVWELPILTAEPRLSCRRGPRRLKPRPARRYKAARRRDCHERTDPDDLGVERRGAALWLTIQREERRNAMSHAVLAGMAAGHRRRAGRPRRCAPSSSPARAARPSAPAPTCRRPRPSPPTTPSRTATSRSCCGGRGPAPCRWWRASTAPAWPAAWACWRCATWRWRPATRSFGLPEVKVGVFPAQVLTVLQHLVPRRKLAELCLTGESARRGAGAGAWAW